MDFQKLFAELNRELKNHDESGAEGNEVPTGGLLAGEAEQKVAEPKGGVEAPLKLPDPPKPFEPGNDDPGPGNEETKEPEKEPEKGPEKEPEKGPEKEPAVKQKLLTKDDLTDDQKAALEYINSFMESECRQMVLCGPAGTGKTSLVNVLLDELDKKNVKYVCTAPTNKAVEVIAKRTNRQFDRTIFSLCGLKLVDLDDREPYLERDGESKLGEYDIVVIDEASMTGTELLRNIEGDLVEFSYIKVLYVGDPCQIPAVEDSNRGLLQSPVFNLQYGFMLNKVMRTALDNPIMRTVTMMRQHITEPGDYFDYVTEVGESGGIYFYTERSEFMAKVYEYFTSDAYKEDTDYALAIAYRNVSVDALNKVIRRRRYPGVEAEYVEGEELRMARGYRRMTKSTKRGKVRYEEEPVYSMEERVKVLNVIDMPDGDPEYHIGCYKLTVVNFRALPGHRKQCTAYVVKPSEKEKLDRLKADLAKECRERAKELGQMGRHKYTKKEAWEPYNKLRNHFMYVGYIYAMTVYKAQGTTVQNAFVVERDMNVCSDVILRNKLKYTAFTRAAKELHVLD